MRIRVLSDVHIEFHRDDGESLIEGLARAPADVLVLAGDIGYLRDAEALRGALERLGALGKRLVYVPGNHEYYQFSAERGEPILERLQAELPSLTILRAGAPVEIDGRRFLGDTLWFPDSKEAEPARPFLNDFRVIDDFEPWVYERNRSCVSFLERELRLGDVVVTHHLPSPACIHAEYRGSPLNPFFLCDMDRLISERAPALWIHGHTHERVDARVGSTRIVANPLGYPDEARFTRFEDPCIVEV